MSLEWILFSALLLLAAIPFFQNGWRLLIPAIVLFSLAVFGATKWYDRQEQRAYNQSFAYKSLPSEGRPGGYVSSDTCQSCHPEQYATWHRSYHRTMTQYATPETVRGKFDGSTLELDGEIYKLERRGDEFWVQMIDPDWKLQAANDPTKRSSTRPERVWKRVGIMTGSHHMQAYWIPSKEGNLQINFPFSFLFADQRWVPRNDTFLMDPKSPAPVQLWNANCIQCHATAGQPRPETNNPALTSTRVAELGIACEACHGPAEEHIAANRNPVRRYTQHNANAPDPTIVNPAKLDHERSSEVCGQCHGIKWVMPGSNWRFEGFGFRPGDTLEKHFPIVRPVHHANEPWLKEGLKRDSRFIEDRYWSDGMVRVSGRDFNGLLETPCYQKGKMSCLSCHSMHHSDPDDQLAARMDSNQACLQCHITMRIAEHTHHPGESSGSVCYNCHMPHTTYGLMKAIRSHTIDSPNVETTRKTGRPNACNLCHLDKTLAWTGGYLTKWYKQQSAELPPDEQSISASALMALRGDAGQRALVAWHMGWEPARKASGEGWIGPYLAQLLEDPYSTVRYIAHRSLEKLPGFGDFSYDFIGPAPERSRAREMALAKWESGKKLDRSGPEILMDGHGSIDHASWTRLLGERNNRSMYLQE